MADTITVNGTDLSTYAIITSFDGALSEPAPENDPIVLPHVVGGIFVASVRHPYSWDLPLAVTTDSQAALVSALNSLKALLDSHTAAKTFVRSYAGATATSVGMVAGPWQPQILGDNAARIPLTIMNLDGGWT